MNKWRLISLIFVMFLFSNFFINFNVKACKDILACGDATGGDYNLLMKVRDPTRPGLQVLSIVPDGYEYTYHKPWTGKPLSFKTDHKYIGIVSKGDTIPNIVKAGMCLSDVGISYGDADTNSNWINPTKHAWDDFDWIRYACEKANDEDEAISLMTKDVIKKMHAPGISENLFIVGPNKGVVIEADAFRYKVKEIKNGVVVMANYPKELWKSQIRKKLPIAIAFNTVVEKYVINRGVIRLKSIRGIKVMEIGKNFVYVKPVPFIHAAKTGDIGVLTKIYVGERETVGHYSVELKDIDGNRAKLRVCYKANAWEEKMMDYIQPQYGHITITDMINWSRLETEDLDGLRGMCQDVYENEAVAVYKIPKENYEILSCGWFSANHACSSIYVPFHICNNDIYDPYETGDAAQLSLDLFNKYEHDLLGDNFSKVENVFYDEIDFAEKISTNILANVDKISDFLTIIDMSMQKQAFLTEEIWMEVSMISNQKNKKEIIDIISRLWDTNFSYSLVKMKNAILDMEDIPDSTYIRKKILGISLDICSSRIEAAKVIVKEVKTAQEKYDQGLSYINQGQYENGFDYLQKAYTISDMLIKEQFVKELENEEIFQNNEDYYLIISFSVVIILVVLVLVMLPLKKVFK